MKPQEAIHQQDSKIQYMVIVSARYHSPVKPIHSMHIRNKCSNFVKYSHLRNMHLPVIVIDNVVFGMHSKRKT